MAWDATGYGSHGEKANAGTQPATVTATFLPTTAASTFAAAAELNAGRFYPTTVTLPDGRALTLFGQDNASAGVPTAASYEVFTPGGAGAWSAPKALPSTISTTPGHSCCPAAICLLPALRSLLVVSIRRPRRSSTGSSTSSRHSSAASTWMARRSCYRSPPPQNEARGLNSRGPGPGGKWAPPATR